MVEIKDILSGLGELASGATTGEELYDSFKGTDAEKSAATHHMLAKMAADALEHGFHLRTVVDFIEDVGAKGANSYINNFAKKHGWSDTTANLAGLAGEKIVSYLGDMADDAMFDTDAEKKLKEAHGGPDWTKMAIGAAVGAVGAYVLDKALGRETSLTDLAIGAATGAAGGYVLGHAMHSSSSEETAKADGKKEEKKDTGGLGTTIAHGVEASLGAAAVAAAVHLVPDGTVKHLIEEGAHLFHLGGGSEKPAITADVATATPPKDALTQVGDMLKSALNPNAAEPAASPGHPIGEGTISDGIRAALGMKRDDGSVSPEVIAALNAAIPRDTLADEHGRMPSPETPGHEDRLRTILSRRTQAASTPDLPS